MSQNQPSNLTEEDILLVKKINRLNQSKMVELYKFILETNTMAEKKSGKTQIPYNGQQRLNGIIFDISNFPELTKRKLKDWLEKNS